MSDSTSKSLPLSEKVSYAFGDMASNFYWGVISVFLMYFYTDVFGISPVVAGTMMFVTKIIDAFTDPIMGGIADRTNTRWGKFRPYLIWGSVPLMITGILALTVPELDGNGKLIWAYATYILMMMAYTFINVPYGALMGVMTRDTQERTMLSSFRFVGAFIGSTIVSVCTLKLVAFFGGDNEPLGWQLTMAFYGVLAIFMFASVFYTSRERIVVSKPPASVKEDLADLIRNKPWLILFALAMIIMLTITLRASVGTYYFKYYVGDSESISTFLFIYSIALTIGAALTPLMTKYMDKRNLLMLLMGAVAVLSAIFFFIPKDQVTVIYVLQFLIGLCLGPKSPLVFSMYADTADYSQYQTGNRATAMVFSAAAFSQKLGGAFGSFLIGAVLSGLGYAANQVQSADSEMGILLLMTIIPGFFALLAVWIVKFYPLTNEKMQAIHEELATRDEQQNNLVKGA